MIPLNPSVRAALVALAEHCSVGAAICDAAARGHLQGVLDVRRLCSLAGIAQVRVPEVTEFLEVASEHRLVERVSEISWRLLNMPTLTALAPMLLAINIYRNDIHQDRDRVDVVLTKPPSPSMLTQTLQSMLQGTWGLRDTREVLPVVAEKAQKRFVVMTPFLDEYGGNVLCSLFKNVRGGAEKQLIIRTTAEGGLPEGYLAVASSLNALGVSVFNFRLEKPDTHGNETFHAKVVIADHECAYVGSSNMNKWSFQYSLELGLLVSGKAAGRIGQIIDAILAISSPLLSTQ